MRWLVLLYVWCSCSARMFAPRRRTSPSSSTSVVFAVEKRVLLVHSSQITQFEGRCTYLIFLSVLKRCFLEARNWFWFQVLSVFAGYCWRLGSHLGHYSTRTWLLCLLCLCCTMLLWCFTLDSLLLSRTPRTTTLFSVQTCPLSILFQSTGSLFVYVRQSLCPISEHPWGRVINSHIHTLNLSRIEF